MQDLESRFTTEFTVTQAESLESDKEEGVVNLRVCVIEDSWARIVGLGGDEKAV